MAIGLMAFFTACKRRPLETCWSAAALVAITCIAVYGIRQSTAQDVAPLSPAVAAFNTPARPVTPAAAPAPPSVPQWQPPLVVAQLSPQQPVPPAEPTPAPGPAPIQSQPESSLPAAELHLQLALLSAAELHARLEQAFGRQLPLIGDANNPWLQFSVEGDAAAPLLIAAHRQTGDVRLVGRPEQLRAWREIIRAIDSAPPAGQVTRLVAANKAAAPHVRQTVGVLLAQAQPQQPGAAGQPAEAGQPAAVPPQDSAAQPGAAAALAAESNALLGPVQIEVIEGTEFFVIRGNPGDVERVLEVIRQIEDMSRVTPPTVLVQPLQHVDSESVALLLQQLFSPVAVSPAGISLSTYFGPLLALPLGKPNAVLLVGGPATVAKALELLKQLDVSGESLTQFEAFPLKHATAEQAQLVVEQLFVGAQVPTAPIGPPLGPKALVIAETRTNSLIVRASPRDMVEVRALIRELDRPSGDRVDEMRVFRLKHALAADLAPVLQRAVRNQRSGQTDADAAGLASLLRLVTIDAAGKQKLESGVLAGVIVNADTRQNSLVVTAPAESMPLMAALIEQLDQPPDAVAELKVFTIENGDAVSLADMLRDLFGSPEQGGQEGGGGGGGGAQNAGNRIFQLRFSVDERTNSIIAAGSSDELLVVEAVLLRLDVRDAKTRRNEVYKLKNADAEQVALALQQWLQAKRDVELTAPGATSPFQQIESEVVVVAEINSNSLIVSATPTYYQEITDIVEQLDEQAPMVMIQVLIGEVTLGDADEFGVELGLQDSVLFDRSLIEEEGFITTNSTLITQTPGGATTQVEQQIVQSAPLTPGFNFGDPARPLGNSGSTQALATAGAVGAQSLSSFAVGRVNPALGFGGLVLSASSDSVSMLLRALQETRRLEVLSRPQIMALDNLEGRAFVGEIVPIITRSEIDAFGRPQNVVEPVDVGLELRVRPRISPEDLVVMEVAASKRELGPLDQGVPISIAPNGDPIRVPRINSIEAQTTVSAVSGQTVVLSGLLSKRDEALHRRVPLLADIPLLGSLFRYDSSAVVRRELLIVLTPHVIRTRRDAEVIKQVESARMSWCLSDVVDLHGPAGLRSRNDPIGAAEAETVYPHETPDANGNFGDLPGPEAAPTPAAPMPADDYPRMPVPPQTGPPPSALPVR